MFPRNEKYLLTKISVKNLACFGDADYEVNFAPETAIIGPNNVGKSVFIGGFNFLRSNPLSGIWMPPNWNSASYSWGSFETIVHRHLTGRVIKIIAGLRGDGWEGELEDLVYPDRGQSLLRSKGTLADFERELRSIWFLSASRGVVSPTIQIGTTGLTTQWRQPLNPDGSNVVPYLLERYTSRDPRWDTAEKWLSELTHETFVLKSPLRGNYASVETTLASGIDVNVAYQGMGIQKALSTVAALVFSPEGSTIIIEEPEIHLHKRSQEVLIDLFNTAVNDWKKQVIFSSHSWEMLLPFVSDVGKGSKRGRSHVEAKPENFKLVVFDRVGADIKLSELDIKNMAFMDFQKYLKELWG
jgi:hypothetical protein